MQHAKNLLFMVTFVLMHCSRAMEHMEPTYNHAKDNPNYALSLRFMINNFNTQSNSSLNAHEEMMLDDRDDDKKIQIAPLPQGPHLPDNTDNNNDENILIITTWSTALKKLKKQYPCRLGCDKTFNNRQNRWEHEQAEHKNMRYSCLFCEKIFKRLKVRNTHQNNNCPKRPAAQQSNNNG